MENVVNCECKRYKFIATERNRFPAPLPYIVKEEELPKNQRILVFLPHSDDGRYFGMLLYFMNRNMGNDIKIVIMCSGHHGVDEDIPKEKKMEQRWSEALCWGEMLGFKSSQFIDFKAEKTYDTQKSDVDDRRNMKWLIGYSNPSMIFIPHISDTAQAMNYHTRDMVIRATTRWMTKQHQEEGEKKHVFAVEYPTNHVPFIPPSDRNFIFTLTDPGMANIKHEANKAHESQMSSMFDMTEKMIEAVGSVTEADNLKQLHKSRKYARLISGIDVDPMTSRGEHFGVTKIRLKGETDYCMIEEQIKLPFTGNDKKKWFGE
jgi:LmbE family N-acetylglucosaminyl deacetylase